MLVLGIAYKRNIGDVRESPAVAMMELLRERGARVSYSDPHVPVFPEMREHHFDLSSVRPTPDALRSVDVVLLATDHDRFDWELVAAHAPLVIDTRGVYTRPAPHIVPA